MVSSINEPAGARSVMLTPMSINEPPARPEGLEAPTLTTIQPAMATIGGADVTMQCVGTGFTPTSIIMFNNGEEPTQFHSSTKVTTIVRPVTATTPGVFPVAVVTPFGVTETLTFEFLEPSGGTRARSSTDEDYRDPDELEDELEQAREEGDYEPLHRGKPAKKR